MMISTISLADKKETPVETGVVNQHEKYIEK